MAKIKKRGESGAAKNYTTRTQAIRKLQISLADFRRLCILKGIYPREPNNKKKANKGSIAPTSFYYHKDIQYLLHEPLLAKFREHKAFAKKLARAVGRQEWGLAKNLEDAKPVIRLDHLVKERYPTFTLALQDLQDPLNLLHLFSTLPTAPIPGKAPIPSEIINDCSRLISEWKVWAIRTHSLRKMFLGIKGIYYEISVPSNGQDVPVRWLEGYEFQQHVPTDVDFRILLTFIELYRVLLGFVLFRLYTEENLVYPPPLDKDLDERGESVGAFKLVQRSQAQPAAATGVSRKEVKRAIKGIAAAGVMEEEDAEMDGDAEDTEAAPEAALAGEDEAADEFIERPTKDESTDVATGSLPTFANIVSASSAASTSNLLFAPYTFYISRETSSRTWEFVVRAMGGKCISSTQCPDLSAKEADGITHVIIDRPMTEARKREMESGRKWVWVQPQWVADCVNSHRILGAEEYKPGALLPPHLSPWDGAGEAARPWVDESAPADVGAEVEAELEEVESDEEDEEDDEEEETDAPAYPPALLAAAADPSDPTLLHAAELEAESNGTTSAAFKAQLKEATKAFRAEKKAAGSGATSELKGRAAAAASATGNAGEEDLRKIMMTSKKAKLYEKMKHSNKQKQDEKEALEAKRVAIEKRKRKEARAAGRA